MSCEGARLADQSAGRVSLHPCFPLGLWTASTEITGEGGTPALFLSPRIEETEMLKNGILKCIIGVLLMMLMVETFGSGVGIAPVNPAFMDWQRRKGREHLLSKESNATNTTGRFLLSNAVGAERRLLGHVPSVVDYSYLKNINYQQVAQAAAEPLPARFDLRDKGMLTSVKNQGNWGTCWAHAALGSLESGVLMVGGSSVDFSEWHLANTHGFDFSTKKGEGGYGDMAIAYLARWGGPVAESEDPYPSVYRESPKGTPIGHVQNVKILTPMSTAYDTEEIKQTLVEHGAVYASYIHLWDAESSDGKSYYWNGDPSMYQYQSDGGGHAVQIVGWDDNYSKSKFRQTPYGNGAFICKNSWGTAYGENGYFYVSYYDYTFGAQELYSFFDCQDVNNYDGIYQYDPLGHVNDCGGMSPCWGANIFRCGKDNEELAAVGFYSPVKNTKYVIDIYTECADLKPTSGNCQLTQSGICDFVGYVTVPLSSTVAITKGRLFSVVIKLTTPGYNYPLAYEGYFSYQQNGKTYWTPTSDATASAGQSFISSNGKDWSDFTEVIHATANFCCKAYTKSVVAPKKLLSAVSIFGVSSLTSGKSAQFTCKAKYNDGSEADVTDKATWSIAEGRSCASVSASGLVKANEVAEQQTVKVHAKYTEGDITKENDWSFYVTIAAPQPPTDLTVTEGTDASCIRVNWTASVGASSYAVYRSANNSSGSAKYLGDVTATRYSDTDEAVVPGVDYWYFVKAKNASGTSGFSEGAMGWRKLAAPENVNATDGASLENVTVTWSEVKGASHYLVSRSDDIDAEPTPLGTWQSERKFVDNQAKPGVTYYYYVTAAIDASGNRASDQSIFDDGFVAVPVTLDFLTIDGPAAIVSGGNADYACTATYTDKSTRSVTPTWEIVDGADYAALSGSKLTAKTVKANQTVKLKATYVDGVTRDATKSIIITAEKPSAPTSVRLKSATAEAVTITWASVANATGYSVWRGTSTADAIRIADAFTSNEYADKAGNPGVTYTYWVKASNAAGESEFSSSSVSAARTLSAPTGVSATDGEFADKTVVAWKPVPGASSYRVSRADSATGAKSDLGIWQTETSFEDKTGAAGRKYWYFVRSSTAASEASASAYSEGDEGWRKVAVTLSSISISGATRLASGGSTVLSCTALYSDGTASPVTPEWSAEGAGKIGADGRLTADVVTADSSVTVTATYRDGVEKEAKHTVSVIAPVKATAEVKNIRFASRWPFLGKLDVDYELVTMPVGTCAAVTLSGHDDDHDVAMAATTLSGDGAEGAIPAGQHRLTWDVGTDYPKFHVRNFSIEMSAVPILIAAPSNLTATVGTSAESVDLAWAAVENVNGYEVWRGTSSSTNTAEQITITDQLAYSDTDAVAGTTYYYWVISVGEDGKSDFGKPVSGLRAYADITVTFNGNGGTPSAPTKICSPTQPYGELPTAVRTGYQFVGWFTSASGGTQVTVATVVPTTATTLWAHWTANTYTVHFDANGGSGTMSDLPMTYDMEKNLTVNGFVNGSLIFKGWATSADGVVAYADQSPIKNLTDVNGAIVTLYAKWEQKISSLSEAVDNAALVLTTGGSANWTVDSSVAYAGGASARSGEIGDDQTTWIQATVTGPGPFSFRWKVSCEESYDLLTWTLDGVKQDELSGEVDWTLVTKDLTAGTHTVRWIYAKDEGGSEGADGGWIDAVVTPLEMPTNVAASDGTATGNVKISWTASVGATGYTIWRAETDDAAEAVRIGAVTAAPYKDETAIPGKPYYYWVVATDGTRTSAFGTSDAGYCALAAPTGVTASDNALAVGVRVTWDAVEGADGYAIYRGTSTSSGSASQISMSMGPAYIDSEIASGVTYYYFIKATHASGTDSAFSGYDKGSRKVGEPLYVIVDLSGGTKAGNYPISELSSVPNGGWTDEYKTNKLVLRRIANGSFEMGSPLGEIGRVPQEDCHQVTISKPFYIGVFETTQRQYELVMGIKPSSFYNPSCYGSRPVECVGYGNIRGGAQLTDLGAVTTTSFLGVIRAKTGLCFDLPTEAQWEYACRAGTTSSLNSGKNLSISDSDANMDEVGRYWYNFPSGNTSCPDGADLSAGTAAVGSYKPNNWGLYDMHGNVWERCLDFWQRDLGTVAVIDPLVSSGGTQHVARGGGWKHGAFCCRSASRSSVEVNSDTGFRLCCPAGLAGEQVSVSFDANGGSGTMAAVTTGVGGSFAIPAVTFTRTGYSFAGWATSFSGAVAYADGATIASMTTGLTLYAKWTVIVPDAPASVSATDGTYSDKVTVSWSAVSGATSYCVYRYTSSSSGLATELGSTASPSYVDTTATPGVTYYYWVKAYRSDNGQYSAFSSCDSGYRQKIPMAIAISGVGSIKAGASATYTATATYNDGSSKTVVPTWALSSGSSYGSINSSGVLSANGTATQRSVTISASYTENGMTVGSSKGVTITTFGVTVSFNGNGGTASYGSKTYTAYGTYGSLPSASRTQHNFAGWFTAASGGTQVTASSTVPTANMTLYAHWTYIPLPVVGGPWPIEYTRVEGAGLVVGFAPVSGAVSYRVYLNGVCVGTPSNSNWILLPIGWTGGAVTIAVGSVNGDGVEGAWTYITASYL